MVQQMAVWSDFDNDGNSGLIVCGRVDGPLNSLKNDEGQKLREQNAFG